jgi:rubrerythrin
MAERQITASAVISFSEGLEDRASAFYEALSAMFPAQEDVFLGFVDESRKNKVLLIRTYRETVSDALETGFAFEGLELQAHMVGTALAEGTDLAEALQTALEMEEKAAAFYLRVAELSRSLLATIPRAFRRVARRRDERCQVLRSISDESVISG